MAKLEVSSKSVNEKKKCLVKSGKDSLYSKTILPVLKDIFACTQKYIWQ